MYRYRKNTPKALAAPQLEYKAERPSKANLKEDLAQFFDTEVAFLGKKEYTTRLQWVCYKYYPGRHINTAY